MSEEQFLREITFLGEMDDVSRDEYVAAVIEWLTAQFKWIVSVQGKIAQQKRAKIVMRRFKEKGEEIVACCLYTVKPRFRMVWIELLKTLVGMTEV